MKKLLRLRSLWVCSLLLFGLAVFKPIDGLGQCGLGSQYPSGTIAGPTTATTVTISGCNFAGEYGVISGIYANNQYIFAIDALTDGYVTIYDDADAVVGSGASPYTFTPSASGTYKAQWSIGSPGCGTDGTCHTTSVQLIGPATPPAPTPNAGTPTCASGVTLTVAGTPSAGSQWYWQTSATGTSTATPYTGPMTVYLNGTFYVRAFNATSSLWSAASSYTVADIPSATPPPAPTAAQNPACVPGTTISSSAAPAGFVYYWQGTNPSGTSTAQDAATPYNVSTTGTYYVAAYETASQCWSPGTGVSVTIQSNIPAAPMLTDSILNACVGQTPIDAAVTVSPEATSSSFTVTSSLNVGPGATVTVPGTLNLPAGAVITSAEISFNNVTTTGGTWPSDVLVSMNGVVTLGSTSMANVTGGVTNAGPYSLNVNATGNGSYDLVVNQSYSFGGPVTTGVVTLTVYYTLPATITWMDAASGGNVIGTGSPFNVVGTTVMPDSDTEGPYSFYVARTVGVCTSATADEFIVNLSPVLAELIPSDVTCNGAGDGSFTLGTVSCGDLPFTYSVDGGAPGAIPTDLVPGTYAVVITDADGDESATIYVSIAEPDVPQDLNADVINYFNAFVSWTPQGNETEWTVQYGPAGFDPATEGESFVTDENTNVELTGLDANTQYEFYVTAMCGGTDGISAPEAFATNPGFFTWDSQCGPGFIDISGTGTPLDLGDDATTTVTSGFPLSIQGSIGSTITVSNNGWISYNGSNGFVGLDVFSVDLDSEEGNVYYQTMTVNGEELFIVEWFNRPKYSTVSGQNVTFEVIVNGTTGEVFYIYQDAIFGGTQSGYDNGAQSLIQASGPMSTQTVSDYSSTYLTSNSCVRFYYALCPTPTDLTVLPFEEEAQVSWSAGEYGETNWTVVYGPEGFDPANAVATGGVIVPSTSTTLTLIPLLQNTQYDVYVYAECVADDLTSENGLFGTFLTKSFCSKPTALAAATDVDSLEASWNWVLNPTYPDYAIESFSIEYGTTGFEQGEGVNITSSNGTALNDTVVDPDFIAGGVYQYYVQAVCGAGDSISAWAGPFTFTMPLTNDLVCGADIIPVDSNTYVFNNQGATVETGEGAVAPQSTGAQQTDGWINSTLNNTVWFRFTAPASGSVRVNATGISYNGQAAVYTVGDCGNFSSFEVVAANDNEIDGTSLAPNFTVCGLEEGEEYYLLFDGFNGTTGNYSLALSAINLEAGTAAPVTDVCSEGNVDLFTTVSSEQTGGMWSSSIPAVNANISGADFETEGLAYNTFTLQYRVMDGCAYDSVLTTVHVFAPSNAGMDGTVSACRNEPIDLLGGLGGSADLEGTWYNPSDVAITGSEISASNIQGSYSYDYVVSNGICPSDTALVVVNVGSCNFLSLNEEVFNGVEVFPNPSEGIVFITSDLGFSYEVTDANGRVITKAENGVKAAQKTEINLNGVERGVYFIRLNNDDAQKTYRIVIR